MRSVLVEFVQLNRNKGILCIGGSMDGKFVKYTTPTFMVSKAPKLSSIVYNTEVFNEPIQYEVDEYELQTFMKKMELNMNFMF